MHQQLTLKTITQRTGAPRVFVLPQYSGESMFDLYVPDLSPITTLFPLPCHEI
jgi:hypothetical protein